MRGRLSWPSYVCPCVAICLAAADDGSSALCDDATGSMHGDLWVTQPRGSLLQHTTRLAAEELSLDIKDSTTKNTLAVAGELMNRIRNEKAFRMLRIEIPEAPALPKAFQHSHSNGRKRKSFLKKHSCQEEPTLQQTFEEIDRQSPGGVKEEEVMRQYEELGQIGFIFNITGKSVSYESAGGEWSDLLDPRAKQYQSMLQELAQEVKLPDSRFVLSLMDGAPGGHLVFKNEGFQGKELLMLPRALLDWGADVQDMVQRGGREPCQNMVRKGVFRGASTGSGTDGWVFNESKTLPLLHSGGWVSPRFVAANLSKKQPDIIDAGFTQVVGGGSHTKQLREKLRKSGMVKDQLSDDQQRCYAVVVVIDGNAQADRLPRQMAYGTAVLMVHNSTRRWQKLYSNLTKTEEGRDMGNDEFWYGEAQTANAWQRVGTAELEESLKELLENEERRAALASASLEYVKKNLTADRLKCYMYNLMSEYGKRYKKQKKRAEDSASDDEQNQDKETLSNDDENQDTAAADEQNQDSASNDDQNQDTAADDEQNRENVSNDEHNQDNAPDKKQTKHAEKTDIEAELEAILEKANREEEDSE